MLRKVLYPGSFDPPTLGHLDIIERASRLGERLVVGIGINSEKSGWFSVEERLEMLRACTAHLPNVEIAAFEGLLIHFAQQKGCSVMVRGMRAVTDFDYEFRIAMANRTLAPEIETVFLLARDEYSFLASSIVREVARLGGDVTAFVPPAVAESIARRTV
ncbi:MAG: pantetheine-phosphate adenylyltransferase [Fimbriimonadaceae bacterium]|nr:pantetheine-phosphate adenylyltransferase [Fimbriimonadaceae bacterium]